MKIKLIIWDLDDTLWAGTLADSDKVSLNGYRAGIVRTLNQHGIVSSVCSKNDHDQAKAKLIEFGLWDELVFCRIDFAPKGAVVAGLIEDMQLRPSNVLFVDDNAHNLAEVKFHLPDANVIDASTAECDTILAKIVEDNRHVQKSRLAQYKSLEQRALDRNANQNSPVKFLRSCDIHAVITKWTDNLDFSGRIEELVNRSNQLNYTKSRIPEGTASDLIAGYYRDFNCWSVFVWDKYGYHGLVGFAAISQKTKLLHFVFSCRVMHLGIEQWLLAKLMKKFPALDISTLGVEPKRYGWIKEELYTDPNTREFILNKETNRSIVNPELRIMMDCQSGSIAHFAGLNEIADTDMSPRVFKIAALAETASRETLPPILIYAAATDYSDDRAPGDTWTSAGYLSCAQALCNHVTERHKRMMVVLPPESAPQYQLRHGITPERVAELNAIWANLSKRYPEVDLLRVGDFASAGELVDVRHYHVPLLKKIADEIRRWFDDASKRRGNREVELAAKRQPMPATSDTAYRSAVEISNSRQR